MQTLIRFFWLCVVLYGTGVTIYTLMQFTIGERFVVVAWLNNGAYLLWAGAIALIIPCIVFRRFSLIPILLIPAVAFTLHYLPMYFPRQITIPPDSQLLTVLTYNINLAPANIDGIVDDIRNADADIVAIQELTYPSATQIEAELSDIYPYRALHPINSFHGQGVLSKYPILNDDYWTIYLGHQQTEIDLNGTAITLFNVHPVHHMIPSRQFSPSYRTREVNEFLRRASQVDTPIIIAGDFNMTDQAGDYQRITRTYHDSYRAVGYGMGTTFPTHIRILPSFLRIDYVFHSDAWTAIEADVLRSTGGSDHRPMLVTLALEALQ